MKKAICLVLTASLFITSITGCTEKKEKEVKEAKGIFYKVEKEGKTLYLGGSVHVSPKDIEYKFSDEINKAFDDSDTLALEVNSNKINPEDPVLSNATYNSNDSLSNHISEEAKTELEDRLKEVNVPYSNVSKYQLWYIPQVMSTLQMNKLGYKGDQGIDRTFLKKANDSKKEVVGIETIEEQAEVMNIQSEPSEEKLDKKIVEMSKLKDMEEYLDKMVEYVYNGDEKELADMERESQKAYSEKFYNELVTKRDEKMFKTIENYIKEDKKYFVCVGAFHVVGEKGLVYKLQNAGYTVTRI